MQGYTADLYLPVEDMSKEEEEYMACYNNVLKQYGTYVNDLIIICGIRMRLQSGMSIDEYLRTSVSHLNALHESNKEIEPSPFLISLVKVIDEGSTFADIEKICQRRAEEISIGHLLKFELQAVTKALLKHEEQKIEDILKV